MTCHSQIWTNASVTQPIRDSWASGKSIEWTRVHDLPDFVYFNHSIHINKGIGCSTCHGQVDEMPLMYKVNTLNMNWCINCHRNPAKFIRPKLGSFQYRLRVPGEPGGTWAQAHEGISRSVANRLRNLPPMKDNLIPIESLLEPPKESGA